MGEYGDEALRRLEYNDVIRENGVLLAENDALQAKVRELEQDTKLYKEVLRAPGNEAYLKWHDAEQRITQLEAALKAERITVYEEIAAEFSPSPEMQSPTGRAICADLATVFYKRASDLRKSQQVQAPIVNEGP